MKTSLTVMTSLLATCLLLTACDDDFFSPTITIDTPTSAPTFTTTETEVMLGGTVELALDVSAMNVRADTRYVAESSLSESCLSGRSGLRTCALATILSRSPPMEYTVTTGTQTSM